MNQKFSYYLNIILSIGLLVFVLRYGCNPEYKDKPILINEVADSNTYYDDLDNDYSSKIIILYDSIEKLNKGLKTAKIVYKTKIVQVWSDSVVTTEECTEVVNQANEIISSQDSLINIQSRSLDACSSQVVNLRNQVDLNKGYAEKLLNANILVTNENDKLKVKVKRNRLFAGIVSAILVSFVLIK